MGETGVPGGWARQMRRVMRKLARGPLGTARFRAAALGRARRDLVLVCNGEVYTSEQQFAPIYRHGAALARRFGIVTHSMSLADALAGGTERFAPGSILGLMLPYDLGAAGEAEVVAKLIGPAKSRGLRVVLFDGDDDLSVLWGGALAAADLCVKKHVYADRSRYAARTIGKSNLTDYVARDFGWSFADNIIPEAGGHGPEAIARIVPGWNIGLDDKIADLARDMAAPGQAGRQIDILCRASVGPDVWTHPMRNGAVEAIAALQGARVHAPTDRVSQGDYYREMLNAKMSLSPFGFGELCWRDFETVLCGAVLVKPDMGHVETAPDIFEPGETYVPVAWDYADLGAVVARLRADDAERARIAAQARGRLLAALEERWFLERFEKAVLSPLSGPGQGAK